MEKSDFALHLEGYVARACGLERLLIFLSWMRIDDTAVELCMRSQSQRSED